MTVWMLVFLVGAGLGEAPVTRPALTDVQEKTSIVLFGTQELCQEAAKENNESDAAARAEGEYVPSRHATCVSVPVARAIVDGGLVK